ncbi:MAG: methylmalonyl-CoA epimerase [Candidatus Aminicenantes bacterium]|nr:methylmalonyl-CoA epimerase [Candidatus Aminicenantes bacterium]
MKIRGTDHVAVAVRSLEDRLGIWEVLMGVKPSPVEELPERGVRAARFEPPGGTAVELVAPLGRNSPLSGFLESRGEGIHHLCFEVEDIDGAVGELKARGFELVQERPVAGARGTRIVFLHPKSCGGVLVELMEPGRARDQG